MASSLAVLLRAWRERALLSQEQLAARAGVSVRTIRRLETEGNRRPHGDSLRLLAEALGLSEAERAELVATFSGPPPPRAELVATFSGPLPGANAEPLPGADAVPLREARDDEVQAAAVGVPRQLPASVRHFVGRATELKQLTDMLSEVTGEAIGEADDGSFAAGAPPLIAAITGTAGVGKTSFALHWGHQIAGRFPDGQLYANLRGFDPGGQVMDPGAAVRGFLDALGVPPQRIPADADAQAALYRSALAGRRVLILLDNARDSGQVRPLLPGSPGCLVIVTSRNQLTGLGADGALTLNLDLLSTMEAREFLTRRLGPERTAAEQEAVDDIVARCARLPLALAIVAAHATANTQLGLASVAAQLHDAAAQLDVLTGDDPATDVRAVFSWSYQALEPAAAQLFRLLGLHPGADFGVPAAASLAGVAVGRARALLDGLVRASLLVEQPAGRYSQHDLLKAYATEQAQTHGTADERAAAVQRVIDHYLHTAYHGSQQAARRDPITLSDLTPGAIPERFSDDAQALAWFDAEHANLVAVVQRAHAEGFDNRAWQIAWSLTTLFDRRGYWREYEMTQRTALASAQRLGDSRMRAYSHRHLGHAATTLHRFEEAAEQFHLSLELFRRDGDRHGQALVEAEFGVMYDKMERPEQMLAHLQRALELHRATGNRVGEARVLNGVGWAHALLGRHEVALEHCAQSLVLLEELGQHLHVAHTVHSLAYAHHHLGHHDQAVDHYRRAVAMFRDLGDMFFTALALDHLGDVHREAGANEAARQAWREALVILDELAHPNAVRVRAKV